MIDRVCSLLKMKVPKRNRGLLWVSHLRVPSNVTDADGYQTGCVWLNTDGAAGTSAWVNEGSVTVASWVAFDTSAGSAAGTVQFDDATTGPLISIETADQDGDAYLNPFLITGTYASACSKGIALSATNPRPVSFLFDNDGAALGVGDYRAVLSRVYLCSDQTNAVTLNALRGQIKMANLVDVSSGNAVVAPVQGYLELAGTGARTLNGHVACVRAALEEGASGTTTVGTYLAGFEATLNSTRVYAGAGLTAAFLANVSGGTSKWQHGLFIHGDAVSSGIQIGVQGTGVSLTAAFPFAVEVHCEANANIVAGDTGSTAGVYVRYAVEVAQTTNTAHFGVFGKLRVKANLADGNHAGVMGWVEISGTTEIAGIASTTTSAGSFSVIAASGLDLSTGHLNGICVDCSVDDAATISGTLAGIRIKKSAGCYAWPVGIAIEGGSSTIGLEIGEDGTSGGDLLVHGEISGSFLEYDESSNSCGRLNVTNSTIRQSQLRSLNEASVAFRMYMDDNATTGESKGARAVIGECYLNTGVSQESEAQYTEMNGINGQVILVAGSTVNGDEVCISGVKGEIRGSGTQTECKNIAAVSAKYNNAVNPTTGDSCLFWGWSHTGVVDYGLLLEGTGSGTLTTAVGMATAAATNAFSFPAEGTAPVSTYTTEEAPTGKIAILVGGATRYLAYWD